MLDAASLADLILFNATGYLFVTLGVLISIRFAGYPDLTADGSFTAGAVAYAALVAHEFPVLLAAAAAAAIGAMAGICTAAANRWLRLGKIIASVLVMVALISAAPYAAGGATIGLLERPNLLARLGQADAALTQRLFPSAPLSFHFLLSACFLTLWLGAAIASRSFFSRRIGITIRYVGAATSPGLLPAHRRNIPVVWGIGIGNAAIALGGAIEAERRGGFAVGMGLGTILIALACLVLGESIVKTRVRRDQLYVGEYILAVCLGVLTYSAVLQLLLYFGLLALDIRLTAIVLLLALLSIAAIRHPNTARLF